MYRVVIASAAPEVARAENVALAFPPRCPHCGGVTTTKRTLSAQRRRSGFLHGGRLSSLAVVEVPACERMPRPLPAYFAQLALAFLTVASTLAIMATPYAAILALAALAASVATWRARTWISLPTVVDEILVFEVRDPTYAAGLARLNGGRIEGRQPPALAAGDERRAPLPEARLRK
ncbi:MAG TPA: hypothetical protein VM261_29950 [Kofleriaceae bacterium]|nr:hypothetical protein [Kofleriaceae bacterium]